MIFNCYLTMRKLKAASWVKYKNIHPRIHLSKIWKIMEQTDSKGKALPFSFQYAKKNGEL